MFISAGWVQPLLPMKTAGRHHHVNGSRPRYKSDKNDRAKEPDRIIMPIQDPHGSSEHFYRGLTSMEYTDFEEIEAGSSSDYDEMAFQEFAGEDPTRLRVADRMFQA
jgi:hypothetical protein